MNVIIKTLFLFLVASLQQVTVADRCPSSWISWGHYCYRFELDNSTTWSNAESICNGHGSDKRPSHLASIHSREEQSFIYEVFRLATNDPKDAWTPRMYIGLLVGSSATDLSWTDGTCVDYQNWYRGNEPNNFPNSGGQISDGYGKNGRWCDAAYPNYYDHYFVCKMPQN